MEDEIYFEIKSGGDFLRLVPLKLAIRDSEWGADILNVEISACASPFKGNLKANFTNYDFESLYTELEKLYSSFNHEIQFVNFEDDLNVQIKGDGIGHFTADIQVFGGYYNSKLSFSIGFDQSFINEMLRQLHTIIHKYKTT